MRLSTSTCIYFNRPDGTKATFLESIKGCYDAGYRVLDMNFHDAAVFQTPFVGSEWQNWLSEIRNTADILGIEFSQAHSHFYNYCDSSLPERDYLEETVRRSIIGSGKLGVKWVVIHAATDWESATQLKSSREKAIAYFRPLCELAAQNNVGIAIENLWEMNIAPKRRYTSFAEELVELVDAIDCENCGICWDFEHSAIMQQDHKAALALVGDRLKATHVSDFIDRVHDHVLPFHGITDWDDSLSALAQLDYKGDFTYETHRHTMRLPEELIPAGLRYSFEVGTYLVNRYNQLRKEYINHE
jgi:Sugar phosphate isomerases/epimerases